MNKKVIVVVILLILFFIGFSLIKKNHRQHDHYVIGLLQTASFPALDAAREGFVTQIKKEFGSEKVEILMQNAQGSLIQAQAIASSFKANKNIDGFYAIATPAVLALKHEITDKPIVFAAVTDPEGLHLRDKASNITGSTDMANIPTQIFYLTTLMPNLKKVALLYNPGEPNSVILIQAMKVELAKRKIAYEDVGVNSEADVAGATEHAVANVDAILIPTDNTITSAFPIVKQITQKAHVPVVVTWTGEKEGPLMQFGVNYNQSGAQAASLMANILLNKKKPGDIPFLAPSSEVLVSAKELDRFHLVVPDSLKNIVTMY